jgi:hypothetical protein
LGGGGSSSSTLPVCLQHPVRGCQLWMLLTLVIALQQQQQQ